MTGVWQGVWPRLSWPLPGGRGEVFMNVGGGVVMVIGEGVPMVMVGGGVVTWYR